MHRKNGSRNIFIKTLKSCKYAFMDLAFYYFYPFHDAYLLHAPSFYLKYTQEERDQIVEEEVAALEKRIEEADLS